MTAMTPQVGDKVAIDGEITFMRPGRWLKTRSGRGSGTVMRLKNDGTLVVNIPDIGNCLVPLGAITEVRRKMAMDHSQDAAKYLKNQQVL